MTAFAAHSMLPSLSSEEAQHSSTAAAMIRDRLTAAGGWLSFEQFMELALYAPALGYYSAGSIKIGNRGDFITAPEVSDLFSRCVARQCADVLAETGGDIVELGAGTGRMAATILDSLAGLDVLPDRYAILEVSADLADRQRTRMQHLPAALRDRVVWLQRLPETPIRGVILANEVLDALPCRRFVIDGDEVNELGVTLEGESFAWSVRPIAVAIAIAAVASRANATRSPEGQIEAAATSEKMTKLVRELPFPLADGYTSEVCFRVEPWLRGVGECLEKGLLLLFDYGLPRAHYYHPQRNDGTLRCYFKQRAHDNPFINIAVQDITAWVDFTRVAEAAVSAQLEVTGFATQAAFLLGTGIESLTAAPTDPFTQARLAGEARRLLLPGEMGESFKAMGLTRKLSQALRGFAYQDLRGSL